jgi:mono/diheme cytochrome c family protein
MKPISRRGLAGMAVALGLMIGPSMGAQTTGASTHSLIVDSMYGPDLYRMYCATCHGRDGKGNGPVAPALKVAPPDLTILARRQNGVFPAAAVEATITGPVTVPAHGSDEMPVWGVIFRALDPSDTRTRARIKSLVGYLQSIQQK